MLIWLAILAFGLPAYWAIRQANADKRQRENRLDAIQQRLAQKREQAIQEKVESIKNKAMAKRAEPENKHNKKED
jgi:preprotein translocase subunit YajC